MSTQAKTVTRNRLFQQAQRQREICTAQYLELLSQSAEQGCAQASAAMGAMYLTGYEGADGVVIKANNMSACMWLSEAALRGDRPSQALLSQLITQYPHLSGFSADENARIAAYWENKSSQVFIKH